MTPPVAKRLPARVGTVRIIGGRWKRTPLAVGDAPGLRPTPDRVRETLFNWLAHALGDLRDRSFLDLYAGSGALGFEAASRGAGRVVMVEQAPRIASALHAARARLAADAVDVRQGDALAVARRLRDAGDRFDVIFLDPPFGHGLLATALPAAVGLCAPSALVYVESESAMQETVAAALGLTRYRADKAGDVFYHLLQCKKQVDEETT